MIISSFQNGFLLFLSLRETLSERAAQFARPDSCFINKVHLIWQI